MVLYVQEATPLGVAFFVIHMINIRGSVTWKRYLTYNAQSRSHKDT